MSQGKKNFVIQSFKQQSVMDATTARRHLTTLCTAIDEIYNQNASNLSFEELYRNAYNLVLHKHGELLYDSVGSCISKHLEQSVSTISSTMGEQILQSVVEVWDAHEVAFVMIKNILMYMDRTFVIPRKKMPVYYYCLKLFRDIIIYNPSLRDRLRIALLENIALERHGCLIPRDLMQSILSMYADLGIDGINVYEEEFEIHFLDETRSFYKIESLEYLSQNSCEDYFVKAESRLNEEISRVTHYLSTSTDSRLRNVVQEEWILQHAKTILDIEQTGFTGMLRDSKLDSLKRMYKLFTLVPSCLDMMRETMGKYIIQQGMHIVNDQDSNKDPVQFVRAVLDLSDKFDSLIKTAFRSDKQALKVLKEAFEAFINKDNRCSSHLASYIDDLLRSGLQGSTEEDAETKLEKVIVIFKYLTDKDVFENYYRVQLAKRLLAAKSLSDDTEKVMISKLKAECGYQYTSKLEGMFVDINVSKSVMDEYRKTNAFQQSTIELELNILTNGYWPLQSPPLCLLPPRLQSTADAFTAFYIEKNNGRKMAWLTNHGSVDIKASFPGGRKDLNVSLYQACMLLLFNECAETALTLQQLREALGEQVPELELRRHLLSLCTPKLKILMKASKGKGIEDNDTFKFNNEFTSKFKRIKVPMVSAKDVATANSQAFDQLKGSSNTNDLGLELSANGIPLAVEEDRRHLIEAAIVRIMKSRKVLAHNELIAEVTRQLTSRFNPAPQVIKKRVESLMEREYLQRDKDDARVYHYLA